MSEQAVDQVVDETAVPTHDKTDNVSRETSAPTDTPVTDEQGKQANIRQADTSTDDVGNADPINDQVDTFDRPYVEKLRREAAGYRERAHTAESTVDDLKHRLHAALVKLDGRLIDADDLVYDDAYLDDEAALTAAIDDLVARKPHLQARKITGDVGAGRRGQSAPPADLISLIRR